MREYIAGGCHYLGSLNSGQIESGTDHDPWGDIDVELDRERLLDQIYFLVREMEPDQQASVALFYGMYGYTPRTSADIAAVLTRYYGRKYTANRVTRLRQSAIDEIHAELLPRYPDAIPTKPGHRLLLERLLETHGQN